VQGRRLLTKPNGYLPGLSAGEYGKIRYNLDVTPHFKWWQVAAPDGSMVSLNPTIHTVTEHPDGTITVKPSIVTPTWHGWLIKGVWREVGKAQESQ